MAALRRDDLLLSTHRGHGHTLAKGADPTAMMEELLGRAGGCCGGKGGSMHIADFGVGMLGANGVVRPISPSVRVRPMASSFWAMTGSWWTSSATARSTAGRSSKGLNWAAVFGLPVLFVCEDNEWSATTHTVRHDGGRGGGGACEVLRHPHRGRRRQRRRGRGRHRARPRRRHPPRPPARLPACAHLPAGRAHLFRPGDLPLEGGRGGADRQRRSHRAAARRAAGRRGSPAELDRIAVRCRGRDDRSACRRRRRALPRRRIGLRGRAGHRLPRGRSDGGAT
jgi:hypothetical protein